MAEELGLPRTNFWIHPHNDCDAAVERFMQDTPTCGVAGAMMAGLLTTIAMVGMRKMTPLVKRIYS